MPHPGASLAHDALREAVNAPILADKQGTPARPTRGLPDTTLDSQNKDRALSIVGGWLAFMIGLTADDTVT
jgi:hypothetical protein